MPEQPATADNPDILAYYINSVDIFNDEECVNCNLLPICAGGCPSKRMFSNKSCLLYKNYIDDFAGQIAEGCIKNV